MGLDPAKSVLFRQSRVKEHAELHLLYSMITPVPWLERNPTYKEQMKEIVGKDLSTYGFLGYPVLQAADCEVRTPLAGQDHGWPCGTGSSGPTDPREPPHCERIVSAAAWIVSGAVSGLPYAECARG